MLATGLDRLLATPEALRGRRYGLLAHGASVTADHEPIHLALSKRADRPRLLLGPEHGYYGVEQDMVATADEVDPWTGVPIVSLYGDSADSLAPDPEVFRGLDLLVVDLQDVGARYYTYAATAVWAAAAALEAGCEVWILDRPNPLGGEVIEGNRRRPGYESFVGAFEIPVRHGLTLAELVRLEARRAGWEREVRAWPMAGWRRDMAWEATGRSWIAPSPNLPTAAAAWVYPGLCLVEGTGLSEGRGTTRPFQLVGAPGLDPVGLAEGLARRLRAAEVGGVVAIPTYFRPQFQKHRGEVCGGVELQVTDPAALRSYRLGVELLAAAREAGPEAFSWRREAYEFVTDRPAIDLLAGDEALRRRLDRGEDPGEWAATWAADEADFRAERAEVLLYPEGA